MRLLAMDIHKDNDTLGKPLKNNTVAIIDSKNNFLRPFERGMITLSCNTMMAHSLIGLPCFAIVLSKFLLSSDEIFSPHYDGRLLQPSSIRR